MKKIICKIFGHKWALNEFGHIYWGDSEGVRAKGCERCGNIFNIHNERLT